jgi:hypothetical protein
MIKHQQQHTRHSADKAMGWWQSIFIFLVITLGGAVAGEMSLVVTMICRDEEVNFKANLALWLPVAKYFVFMLDTRTKDQSKGTLAQILGGKAQYEVIPYEFEGFGPARTASLEAAWRYFPQASHVMIADPDWRPDSSTMDIQELDINHDVFRFVVYDRNGATTRRMDWLLRHREGLKMRYNLHEVLDIGLYSIKYISWVAREIEKPGTWHTTVGHGNSFSHLRYQFDLSLLNKDLKIYPHDPHVHYYLGITHQAFAEGLAHSGDAAVVHELDENLDKSIYYLKLRVFSEYDDDFIEQRWSSMMLLGSIYTNYKKDFTNAELWFSLCRDYNPRQCECSLALARLYVSHGSLDLAFHELEKILRTDVEQRLMLNWLKTYDCDVPQFAVTVFSHYVRVYAHLATPQDAMLLLLLRHVLDRPECEIAPADRTLSRDTQSDVRALLSKLPTGRGAITLDSTMADLCANDVLQHHLVAKGYRLHPCAEVTQAAAYTHHCGDFHYLMPPPIEEHQTREKKEFIGSASLIDIVHHVYAGDSRRLKPAGRKYRVLFGEFFNPRNVYSLLGQTLAQYGSQVEVVVVVPPADMERWRASGTGEYVSARQTILDTVASCFTPLHNGPPPLTVVESTLSDYLSTQLSDMMADKNKFSFDPTAYLFDFIEYNGGMSASPLYREHLRLMTEFLVPDGAVGVTYFTKNIHQETIARLVSEREEEVLVPFSLQPKRTSRAHLQAHKAMEFLAEDEELVGFLAGDMDGYLDGRAKHGRRHRTEYYTRDGLSGKAFLRGDVEQALVSAGLEVKSWVPSAFSHPFEELDHYTVQRYRSLGMSEEDFLYYEFPSFRYTVYAVRGRSDTTPPGRARVGPWMIPFPVGDPRAASAALTGPPGRDFNTQTGEFVILDRLGPRVLSATFANSARQAAARISTSFAFSHYNAAGGINFTHIALPTVSACLSALSSKPTVRGLMQINRELHASIGQPYEEQYGIHLLLQLLKFFESINVISVWYVDRADAAPANIQAMFEVPKYATQASKRLPTATQASKNAHGGTVPRAAGAAGGSSSGAGGSGGGVGERKNKITIGPVVYARGGPPWTPAGSSSGGSTSGSASGSASGSTSGGANTGPQKVGGLNVQRKASVDVSNTGDAQAGAQAAAPGETKPDPMRRVENDQLKATTTTTTTTTTPQATKNRQAPTMTRPEDMNADEVEVYYTQQTEAMKLQGFPDKLISEAIAADRARRSKRTTAQGISGAAQVMATKYLSPENAPKVTVGDPDLRVEATGGTGTAGSGTGGSGSGNGAGSGVGSGSRVGGAGAGLGLDEVHPSAQPEAEQEARWQTELALKRDRMERMGFPADMVDQALRSEEAKLRGVFKESKESPPVQERPVDRPTDPSPAAQEGVLRATMADKRQRMVTMGFPEALIAQALKQDEEALAKLTLSTAA